MFSEIALKYTDYTESSQFHKFSKCQQMYGTARMYNQNIFFYFLLTGYFIKC